MQIRPCRIAFLYNYFLAFLCILILILIGPKFSEKSFFVIFAIIVAIFIFLIQEPEIERISKFYTIDKKYVIKTEGILRKKRSVIPIKNIVNLKIEKGLVGRIFNFGNVEVVSSSGEKILIEKIRYPDRVFAILKKKIKK